MTKRILCADCGGLLYGKKTKADHECTCVKVPYFNYGWICPVCGRGNSPYTLHCSCKPPQITTTDKPSYPWTYLSNNTSYT